MTLTEERLAITIDAILGFYPTGDAGRDRQAAAVIAKALLDDLDIEPIKYEPRDIIERMDSVYGGPDAHDDAELLADIATWVSKAHRSPLHDITIATCILDIVRHADNMGNIDAMLNAVHPETWVIKIDRASIDSPWATEIEWLTKDSWCNETGTGPTRTAAIADACKRALEGRGDE